MPSDHSAPVEAVPAPAGALAAPADAGVNGAHGVDAEEMARLARLAPPEHPEGGSAEGPAPGTRFEAAVVSALALGMMILPVLQSLARLLAQAKTAQRPALLVPLFHLLYRVFGHEIPGSSLYVQHATLWLGFLGALLATAGGKHLGLATANFLPRSRLRTVAEWTSVLTFFVVTAFLAYASARMVAADRIGNEDSLPGGIPEWWTELIMPLGFALMAVRVVVRASFGHSASGHSAATPPLPRPRRLALAGAALLLATVAVYIGLRFDQSFPLRLFLGKVVLLRAPVLWGGSALLLASFLLGTPVFVTMAGVAMVLFFASATPIASVPSEIFRLVQNPALPAIPLLTMAGYILAAGNASQRLVRAYKSLFGWLPGGVAVMAVFVCALFTTFTGASGVTILALGGLVYPMLRHDRYPESFSLGLVTAAGSLGLLFPPSLPVLLYGVAASAPGSDPRAQVTVDQLFIGGLIPGGLMIFLVSLYGVRMGIKMRAPRQPFRGREVLHAMWDAKWDLLLPLLVIGAFASGFATVVEAAALGATYALLVELLVYRDVDPLKELPGVLAHGAALVGAVLMLLGVALAVTVYLVQEDIPGRLVLWVQGHIHSQWLFLLALNLILLVLGSVLEIYSAIVVLVPLVAPLGVAYNVHPVHLGVIFLANLELGFLFPPMGLNLFLSATRFQKPLPVLYRHALPFLLIMSAGVLIITYFEGATTGLLHLLGK